MTKKIELVFAEGCFDGFDGTQEELAEMIADIRKMVESGTLLENSMPVSEEDEAELIKLMAQKQVRQ
jgi:hypothetical protein